MSRNIQTRERTMKNLTALTYKKEPPRNRTELQSQVIDWLRLPLIYLILVTHVNPHMGPFYTPLAEIDYAHLTLANFYSLLGRTGSLLGFMAVPFFFFTSGYFFFYKTEQWGWSTYRDKIGKRIRTLLVPYLLWNALCLVLNVIQDTVKYFTHGQPQDRLNELISQWGNPGSLLQCFWARSIWDVGTTNFLGFKTWMTGPIILPFWFLRDLIIVSLLSPLIYRAIRWGKHWFIGLLGVAYLLKLWTTPGLGVTCIFFFSFGAYLSLNRRNIIDAFFPLRKPVGWLTAASLIAAVFVYEPRWSALFSHAFCLTGMISAINLATILFEKKKVALRPGLTQTCFFVYALHGMRIGRFAFLGLGMTIADAVFRGKESVIGALGAYLASPLLGLILCMLMFFVMKRFTPGLLKVLIGGRL